MSDVETLTEAEARLLGVLRAEPGKTFDRDALAAAAGLNPEGPLSRCIDALIARVRRKLGDEGRCLMTDFGAGYRWGPARDDTPSASTPRVRLGAVEVDLDGEFLVRDAQIIALTSLEARVLRRLLKTPGEPVAPELLGPRGAIPKLALQLRRKLGDPGLIVATRGVGYSVAAPRGQTPRLSALAWEAAETAGAALQLEDVVVYRREGSLLVQIAAWGPKHAPGRTLVAPMKLPIGTGIVGAAVVSGRVSCVPETRADRRYVMDLHEARSELTVPILVRGEVIGAFDCEASTPAAFTPRHATALTAVARLLSAAL